MKGNLFHLTVALIAMILLFIHYRLKKATDFLGNRRCYKMRYAIFIVRYAQKQIMKLDKQVIPVIKAAIARLADNPRPYGYKKL